MESLPIGIHIIDVSQETAKMHIPYSSTLPRNETADLAINKSVCQSHNGHSRLGYSDIEAIV